MKNTLKVSALIFSAIIIAHIDLPQISGPVSMREPGRFEGKAIWP
jgi:hypothetical protein